MVKAIITGATFYGSGKFSITFPVPAMSGEGKSGKYEGFGLVQPYRGTWGVSTPELREKIIKAINTKTPCSLIYDSFGNITNIMF